MDSLLEFSADLYSKIAEGQKKSYENVFVSPVSIYTALSMVLCGSEKATREEMKKVLKISPSIADKELSAKIGSSLMEYFSSVEGVDVLLANRLFVDKKLQLNKEYETAMKSHFKSGQESVDFLGAPEAVRQRINAWVSENTKEKIKELLPAGSVKPDTVLSIVNALFFKGIWMKTFIEELTADGEFHKLDSTKMNVKLMYKEDKFPYAELPELDAQAVKLPFKDPKWEMLIVLPNANNGLDKVVSHICKPGNLASLLKTQFEETKIEVFVPRFKLGEGAALDAKRVLSQMGMKRVFSAQAELSSIASGAPLYVSDLFHKAILEVNEQGATAAAATGSMISLMCYMPKPIVRVDHPFIVGVIYNKTVPVFFGHVTEPQSM